MARVFSGIQPSGEMTLGAYLGALRRFAMNQDADTSFFCIVDLHALTTPQEPDLLRERVLRQAAIYLAAGIDPARSTIFVQSTVPEHAELAWLIECNAAFGELSRMTQFKEKSERSKDFVSAALFTYPALMAADILLYDTDFVPVGDDQRQHLELTRDVAQRFNGRYGTTFVVPEALIPTVGARIMDLQTPTNKMSKSVDSPQGTVLVLDSPTEIDKKFKRAVTDNDAEVRFDRDAKPGVSNLLEILAAATDDDPAKLADKYTQYGALKTDTAAAVVELLRPVQARFDELIGDPAELRATLAAGAAKAQSHAATTLHRAQAAVGLR
ncbi:MAG: tryptophanyl-tRNA synthetase [Actinomycetota bacterium]|nr:tryptophanyl-tRNA synthetase [Actinomycetota bacterium]